MEPVVGLRVVRGPDWEWGDQDGGEGFVGTVAGLEGEGGGVIVQWDMGQRCRYRCGRDSKFDLRVLDCGPIPRSQASDVDCAWCQAEDLVGCVWRCIHCLDYHLCSQCYLTDRHSTWHPFFRVTTSNNPKNRERVGSRQEADRVPVKGTFPGARVTRGCDWKWGDQDGGVSGIVLAVKGWRNETKVYTYAVHIRGNDLTRSEEATSSVRLYSHLSDLAASRCSFL
jgi:E3 ubiquitin-protein ligase mind-bomb